MFMHWYDSKALQDISFFLPGLDFLFTVFKIFTFELFQFMPVHANMTLEFCHLLIKKMMWLSLFLS